MVRIGSLFTGVAGLDMAVQDVFGGTHAWFSEIDPAASKVLAYRFPGVPNLGDITKIDWQEVEPVDVLCGGFPCQDVSSAGRRAGIKAGTRSGLWNVFAEAIDALRPQWVVIENVRGLLSATAERAVESGEDAVGDGAGRPFLRAAGAVLGDLADLGYDAQWATVAAADVGAPHRRERVFIVATDTTKSERRGTQQQLLDSPVGSAAEPRERFGATAGCHGDAAHSSRNGWDEGRPESARLVGGFDAAVSGDEPGVALLPTPRSSDCFGAGQHSDGSMDLRTTVTLLPTPKAHDGEFGTPRTTGRPIEKSTHLGTIASLERTFHWGKYAPAIARWEQVTEQPAPPPTEPNKNGNPRLSAAFSEWLMGWPPGWVTDPAIGISRNDQLRCVGRGVVTLQAVAALRYLLAVTA